MFNFSTIVGYKGMTGSSILFITLSKSVYIKEYAFFSKINEQIQKGKTYIKH
jgi:hypothetical protein